jgi:exodeoxyribonuclease-3
LTNMSIATFNVNSVRSRIPILERWLPASGVDVLCLQETKTVDETFPAAFFESLGYDVAFRGEKSYNGVAIASSRPLEDVHFGFEDGEEPSAETRLIRASVNGVNIVNTYVPQGKAIDHPDYRYKLRFLRRLSALFGREYDKDGLLVWLGDLNVAPTDMDVTHPERKKDHVCFHEDLKTLFEEVKGWGLSDLFRKYRPGEGEFSFWDYRVKNALERNIGWRIDHMLTTKSLEEKSVDCYVDREPRSWEKPSDHTPMVARFRLD